MCYEINFCLWDKRLKFSLKRKLFHNTWIKLKIVYSIACCGKKKGMFSNFYLPIIWIFIYCVFKKEEGTWYYETLMQKSPYKASYLSHTHRSSPTPIQFPTQQCKRKTRKKKKRKRKKKKRGARSGRTIIDTEIPRLW